MHCIGIHPNPIPQATPSRTPVKGVYVRDINSSYDSQSRSIQDKAQADVYSLSACFSQGNPPNLETPLRVLMQTLTHLVPSDHIIADNEPYGDKLLLSMLDRIYKTHLEPGLRTRCTTLVHLRG